MEKSFKRNVNIELIELNEIETFLMDRWKN
jgi:hypothetical protein